MVSGKSPDSIRRSLDKYGLRNICTCLLIASPDDNAAAVAAKLQQEIEDVG
jgi:hypothetical protein